MTDPFTLINDSYIFIFLFQDFSKNLYLSQLPNYKKLSFENFSLKGWILLIKFYCPTDLTTKFHHLWRLQINEASVAKGHRLCFSARETIDDAAFTHPMARSNFELYTFVEGMFHGKPAFGTDGPPTRHITAMIAMNDKYSSGSYFN